MKIVYFTRRPIVTPTDWAASPTLEELLSTADFVSLHVPGGAPTRHLIDRERLELMPRHAILVNTSRGEVVDEAALGAALAAGRIAAAGLDVYEDEPRVNPLLLSLENVVLLPHLGSATAKARLAMGLRVIENLTAFFDGRTPPDLVT
jgi:lactate dehydrogenase-like 2-hydroxyacid dehydrogenase